MERPGEDEVNLSSFKRFISAKSEETAKPASGDNVLSEEDEKVIADAIARFRRGEKGLVIFETREIKGNIRFISLSCTRSEAINMLGLVTVAVVQKDL